MKWKKEKSDQKPLYRNKCWPWQHQILAQLLEWCSYSVYKVMSEYNNWNAAVRRNQCRWYLMNHTLGGVTDSSFRIKNRLFVLCATCILSSQQVVSMHTCNHYLHTAGLPQWNPQPCCEHSVPHGLESREPCGILQWNTNWTGTVG